MTVPTDIRSILTRRVLCHAGLLAALVLAVIAAFLLIYSLIAGRFESRLINGPLLFLLMGWLLGPGGIELLSLSIDSDGIKLLAELTLVIVLFSDAANTNWQVLLANRALPIRLLLIGCSSIAILTTAGIILSMLFAFLTPNLFTYESQGEVDRYLTTLPPKRLTGLVRNPQMAIRMLRRRVFFMEAEYE